MPGDMHMIDNRDNTEYPLPADDDPHGWTVVYQTPACDHVHRVLGWTATHRIATVVSHACAALWHPVIRATPVPAPEGESLGRVGVISEIPRPLRDRIAAGDMPTTAEMVAGGATMMNMEEEVRPEVVMIAARLVELLEAKGLDVAAILADAGRHNGMVALMVAAGEDVAQTIMREFPSPGMDIGTGH